MADELESAVYAFTADQLGKPLERLNPECTLQDDFGVDGDDGYDFFVAFSNRFDVDVSTLDLSLHFGPEAGANPLSLWYWFREWLGWPSRDQVPLIPIRVRDLVEAAQRGKWHAVP